MKNSMKKIIFIFMLFLFIFATWILSIDTKKGESKQAVKKKEKTENILKEEERKDSKIEKRIKWFWNRLEKEFNEDDVTNKKRIEIRNGVKYIWTESFEFDEKVQTVEHFTISDGKLQGAALKYYITEEDPEVFVKSLFNFMEDFLKREEIKTHIVFNEDQTGSLNADESSKKCVLIWSKQTLMVNIFTGEVFQ